MVDKSTWQKGLLLQVSAVLAMAALGASARANLATAWESSQASSTETSLNQKDAVAPDWNVVETGRSGINSSSGLRVGQPASSRYQLEGETHISIDNRRELFSLTPFSLAQAPAETGETLPFDENPLPFGEEPLPDSLPETSVPPASTETEPVTENSLDSLLESNDTVTESGARVVNLTLPDLINLTLQGNRGLRNDILDRIVQRQQLNEAEQAFDPRFTPELRVDATRSLSARGNGEIIDTDDGLQLFGDIADIEEQALLTTELNTRQGTRVSVGVDPFDNTQPFQFNVTQPLLRGFGQAVNEAPVEQARLTENQNQLALRDTTSQTITTAITNYTTLIQQQRSVSIQERALDRRQQELEVERALIEAGRRARSDLFDNETSVANAQRDLANARNQLIQANNAILNQIGTDQNLVFVASTETVIQLFENAVARAETYDQEELIALALQQRPDYRQAQLARQQRELDLLLARDGLRWQLDASARGNLGDFSETTVGLFATRIFDQPQLQTSLISSEVALEQQDNNLAQLEEEIRNDIIAGLESVRANLLRVRAAVRATENAEQQLEAARTQFRLGRGQLTQFDLLQREDDLVDAQNAELTAEIAFLNAIAQLEQTVGITLESWTDQVDLTPVLSEIDEEVITPSESVPEE